MTPYYKYFCQNLKRMKKLILITALISTAFSGAFSQTENRTTKEREVQLANSIVRIENQIEISYSIFQSEGKKMLNIHFRNVATESISFDWKIISPEGKTFSSDRTVVLQPASMSNFNQLFFIDTKFDINSCLISISLK